jgi:hypothetical protein
MWKARADTLEHSAHVGVVAGIGILSRDGDELGGRSYCGEPKERTTVPNDWVCVRSPCGFLFLLEGNLIRSLASGDALHVIGNGRRLGRPTSTSGGFADIGTDPKRVVAQVIGKRRIRRWRCRESS